MQSRVFALTGGIATGKSVVSKVFAANGVGVVDADLLAREIVELGSPGLAAYVEGFGEGILQSDGTLDRKKLGAIVFTSKAELDKLNSIALPRIRALAFQRIEELRQTHELVCFDAPTLVESELHVHFKPIVVTVSPFEMQLERIMRRGFTADEARARILSQRPHDDRLKVADFVLESIGTVDELRAKALDVLKKLRALPFSS